MSTDTLQDRLRAEARIWDPSPLTKLLNEAADALHRIYMQATRAQRGCTDEPEYLKRDLEFIAAWTASEPDAAALAAGAGQEPAAWHWRELFEHGGCTEWILSPWPIKSAVNIEVQPLYTRPAPAVADAERGAVELMGVVTKILGAALGGRDATYRTEDGFVRWGRVEKHIHEAIDAALAPTRAEPAPATPNSQADLEQVRSTPAPATDTKAANCSGMEREIAELRITAYPSVPAPATGGAVEVEKDDGFEVLKSSACHDGDHERCRGTVLPFRAQCGCPCHTVAILAFDEAEYAVETIVSDLLTEIGYYPKSVMPAAHKLSIDLTVEALTELVLKHSALAATVRAPSVPGAHQGTPVHTAP